MIALTARVAVGYAPVIMMSRSKLYQPSDADRERARRESIAWAQQVLVDDRVVYLDTETTGLDGTAEIVEISVLDCRGNVLLDTLVQPSAPIPPDAEAIHGISNSMVAGAPGWPVVSQWLREIVARRTVVVYNADFDFRMVSQMDGRHRLGAGLHPWQCAMRRYSGYAGIWNQKYGNYRFHKLDDAVSAFGHPPGGHRALSDAMACKLVVEGMARSG